MNPNNLPKPPQGPDDYHPPLPEDSNAPIPFDLEDEPVAAPKPAAPARPAAAVSHAPLTMGATKPGAKPAAPRAAAPRAAARPAQPRPAQPKAPPGKPAGPKIVINKPPERHVADIQTSDDGRVCGVKTFFTKLHPGAMDFLDDQINDWLKAHPEVRVKMTNTCVGEVASKKTEPNIILTIWY